MNNTPEKEEDSESWWSIIKNKLSAQVNPCINYFTSHKLESLILLILFCMIIYQITIATSEYSPNFHIQSGGNPTGFDSDPSPSTPKKGLLKKIGSLGVSGVKGLGKAASSQFSSGISEPIKGQLDKLAPFRESTGETVRSYIYKLLEYAVIMLIFFPCASLFLIILASYYMIRPKLKFIKGL
jgi:hypothetical protein